MSRKPIDKQQPHECRQAIWAWIREFSESNDNQLPFTARDIDVKLQASTIRDYLNGLEKAGYLSVVRTGKHLDPARYTLIKDTGHEAPRVRKDGTPVTQGIGRQQMWNAMRVLKTFRPIDLAFNSSTDDHRVAENEATTYCSILCKAGYLAAMKDGNYFLIPSMWTGPYPPQIQRTKQVYDPNLLRVVWSHIAGGAE